MGIVKGALIFGLGVYTTLTTITAVAGIEMWIKEHPKDKHKRFEMVKKEYEELERELFWMGPTEVKEDK